VHDRLELQGWKVEIADAQKVKGLAPFDAADFLGALVADGHLELTVDGAGPPTASACD
jgi:hypothetical protein